MQRICSVAAAMVGLSLALGFAPSWAQRPPTNDTSDNMGNTAGGTGALTSSTPGNFNTAYGNAALRTNTGNSNTAVGTIALSFSGTGNNNHGFRFFNSLDVVPNAWASLYTVEAYYPPLVSCPPDITRIIGRAETAVTGKYCQVGEIALGSAIELSGTIIRPFDAHRGRMEPNAFESALFLWEAAQQHACTFSPASRSSASKSRVTANPKNSRSGCS
jgi:hypothetical protein